MVRILILVPYYNRPILLRNAMQSVLRANQFYDKWELAFGDDGSSIPGRPIVEDVLKGHLERVEFYKSDMSFEDKLEHGIMLGRMANEAITQSSADVAITLCDDDELFPTYLRDLNLFFENNPSVLYCYSKIHLFNPLKQKSDVVNNVSGKYNQWEGPIDPVNKVDGCQVAWRLSCCKQHGAWFTDSTKFVSGKPWVKDTDKSFFEVLYNKFGPCYPTGIFAQYKGIHDYQLLWHKNATSESLRDYDTKVKSLAGVKL